MKKTIAFLAFTFIYLGGGALLQRCSPPYGGFSTEFMIEDLDWSVGKLQYDSLLPNQFYDRDSVVINTRLRRIYMIETAAIWSPIPSSFAYSPADPQSFQRIIDVQVTLLDSVLLESGQLLLPQSNVNDKFNVLYEYYEGNRSIGINGYFSQKPPFYTPHVPLRMRWNAPLNAQTSFRVAITLKLDDGQVFTTPPNEPLVLKLLRDA